MNEMPPSNESRGKSVSLTSLTESRRLTLLTGIKIVKKWKIPDDIDQKTEIYDLSTLPLFTLSACYLGYASLKLMGEERGAIPISMIWELFDFTSNMPRQGEIVDRHLMMLGKAFDLFGSHADLMVADRFVDVRNDIGPDKGLKRSEMKYIGFDPKGIHPDSFPQMLMRALKKGF
jgi:hypothetical protein